MSAPQIHAASAIAFQLAATLETYQADVVLLVGRGFDPEVYRRVSAHVDQMRMYAAAPPALSVAWVEVMIRHFELTHGLWRQQGAGRRPRRDGAAARPAAGSHRAALAQVRAADARGVTGALAPQCALTRQGDQA